MGIYTRGLQLGLAPLTQIVQPLNRVTIPLLSAVADDTERFNRTLLRIQRAFLLSTSFAFALVIVFADVIVRIVLGTGWEDVTLILQILCVVGLADSVMYLMYWVYVSRGLSSEYLQASLIYRSLLILALVWAVQYGMVATASTYATLHLFAWPFMIWWANRRAQLPVVQFSWMTIRSFVLNGTLVAAGFGVRLLTDDHGLLISVPATLLAWLAVVLLFWLGIPAFREDTRSIIDSMKLVTSGMLPRRFTRNP